MVMKFRSNAKSKITAIGALAVSVLRYSFGVINFRLKRSTGKLERY
jgi:hypothetical protein